MKWLKIYDENFDTHNEMTHTAHVKHQNWTRKKNVGIFIPNEIDSMQFQNERLKWKRLSVFSLAKYLRTSIAGFALNVV